MPENTGFKHDAEEPPKWLGVMGMMPKKTKESRHDIRKDKRKSDMMPENKGFRHDAEEPPK